VPFEVYREKLELARVLAWVKEKQAFATTTAPTRASVLDEVRKNPDFRYKPTDTEPKFDVDAWRLEKAQFAYWERQFTTNGPTNSPLPKYELFRWATRNLLPRLKKAPTVWSVYCCLLLLSPEDFSTFKVSKAKLAEGAGVSPASISTAVGYLVEWKFLTIKHGLWSPKGAKAAVLPEYKLTTLDELKTYLNGPTNSPLPERAND
jgi:hypothetical protein